MNLFSPEEIAGCNPYYFESIIYVCYIQIVRAGLVFVERIPFTALCFVKVKAQPFHSYLMERKGVL